MITGRRFRTCHRTGGGGERPAPQRNNKSFQVHTGKGFESIREEYHGSRLVSLAPRTWCWDNRGSATVPPVSVPGPTTPEFQYSGACGVHYMPHGELSWIVEIEGKYWGNQNIHVHYTPSNEEKIIVKHGTVFVWRMVRGMSSWHSSYPLSFLWRCCQWDWIE
jgi:hypothetical protein